MKYQITNDKCQMNGSRVLFVIWVLSFGIFSSCAHTSSEKRVGVIKVLSGTNIPSLGIAMDASYDPKTDGIISGYKILSVAITNNSIDIMQMDKGNDKWAVLDLKGRRHTAIVSLKDHDPVLFAGLSERLCRLIEYPLLIQVGETRVIDLLFKDTADLRGFKSVQFTSSFMQRTFEIVASD